VDNTGKQWIHSWKTNTHQCLKHKGIPYALTQNIK